MAAENNILTWDALQKKGREGLGFCYLWKHGSEDINHIFIHYTFLKTVCDRLTLLLQLKITWEGATLNDCFSTWTKDKSISKNMASLTYWYIWLERNKVIFDEKSPSVSAVIYKILGSLNWLPQSHTLVSLRVCSIM
jgi:hypothetical protein